MAIYKAPNNDTFLRQEGQIEGLPEGSVLITNEEYQQILLSRKVEPDPPTKAERIAVKLATGGFPSKGHLFYFIENMRTVAALDIGITKEQAHTAGYAGNPMYRQMVDLYNEILAIEAEP